MKPNRCSVSMPSACILPGSSAERHTIAVRSVLARIGIRIPRTTGLIEKARTADRGRTLPQHQGRPRAIGTVDPRVHEPGMELARCDNRCPEAGSASPACEKRAGNLADVADGRARSTFSRQQKYGV